MANLPSVAGRGPLAVVTGASSGIGAATATALVNAGFRVVLVARGRPALEALAAQLGGAATVEAADASDPAAVQALADRVTQSLGVPDLVVNAAGAGAWRYLEEGPPDDAVAAMGAPYFAAYNVTRAFMAGCLARRSGLFVHVNSPASRLPWPGATSYTAARWALRGLHEALCQDLRGTGVRSAHVVFGKVSSNYFAANPGSEQHLPRIAKVIRTLTPEECADVIVRVARRPRREVVHPHMLLVFYWAAAIVPGLVSWLAAITGRKRTR